MSEVSDVLRDRMREPGGFERMATLSLLAHGVAIAIVLFVPSAWRPRPPDALRPTMMITLDGGAPGPKSGGLTPLGGRPVQAVTPPDTPPVREAVRPPAAKTQDMALPDPKIKVPKAPPAPVKEAPEAARGRTPARGDQMRPGSTVAETAVRGQGFGLSSGGGTASGSYLDVSNFCCPEYLQIMVERIRSNWNPGTENKAEVFVKFTIYRDGSIHDVILETPSGYPVLDLTSQRAVLMTKTLPPLPAAFTNPTLTVHLNFKY